MALVQTDQLSVGEEDILCILSGLVADELGAQITYRKVIDKYPQTKEVLQEVLDDEIQHSSKILALIKHLDSNFDENMEKGLDEYIDDTDNE